MRFMMFVRADKNTEAGVLPSKELVAAMGRFNEEMMKAGVLLAAEGIHPSSKSPFVTRIVVASTRARSARNSASIAWLMQRASA